MVGVGIADTVADRDFSSSRLLTCFVVFACFPTFLTANQPSELGRGGQRQPAADFPWRQPQVREVLEKDRLIMITGLYVHAHV